VCRNGILVGLACQFLLLPFITFLTVKAFALREVSSRCFKITIFYFMELPSLS
jgi:hypothetical protein